MYVGMMADRCSLRGGPLYEARIESHLRYLPDPGSGSGGDGSDEGVGGDGCLCEREGGGGVCVRGEGVQGCGGDGVAVSRNHGFMCEISEKSFPYPLTQSCTPAVRSICHMKACHVSTIRELGLLLLAAVSKR